MHYQCRRQISTLVPIFHQGGKSEALSLPCEISLYCTKPATQFCGSLPPFIAGSPNLTLTCSPTALAQGLLGMRLAGPEGWGVSKSQGRQLVPLGCTLRKPGISQLPLPPAQARGGCGSAWGWQPAPGTIQWPRRAKRETQLHILAPAHGPSLWKGA